MVGNAWLLILLPLETRQVAPDNTVVLKLGNETDNRSNVSNTKRIENVVSCGVFLAKEAEYQICSIDLWKVLLCTSFCVVFLYGLI